MVDLKGRVAKTPAALRWIGAAVLALAGMAVNAAPGAITAQNGKLYDASGKVLVVRGINLQYGDNPTQKLPSIEAIASTSANTVRLQLRYNTTPQQLAQALDVIVANGMVAMVMYWEEDVTCKSGIPPGSIGDIGFDKAMDRWTGTDAAGWKPVLSNPKYRPYLMLNIANEWGESSSPAELDAYKAKYRTAILRLRQTGYMFPLVIDAAHCGQAYSAFTGGTNATDILSADSLDNTVLSVHAYFDFQTEAKIDAAVSGMNATGYAWLWGEVPNSEYQKDSFHGTLHPYLMKVANEQGIGFIAWSWRGNGPDATLLDMSNTYAPADLTQWGRDVVDGPTYGNAHVPGIRESSRLAAAPGGTVASTNVVAGWNLVGNSGTTAIDVSAFNDASKITTVWKWIANDAKWAFYAPSLVGQQLTDYANGKGYDVLSTVDGGEGFWVNAKIDFSMQLPSGSAVSSASFQSMASGWSLNAVGDSPTPSAFNKTISTTPPSAGDIPLNLTTLWAWDAALTNWYFYAPSLEKNGGLTSYIQSKSYLDFGTKVLTPTTGFWVNKP